MEVPSNAQIIEEYDRRRLPLLRELAHKANSLIYEKLKNGPIIQKHTTNIITNPLIENVDEKDADYLFFALWDVYNIGIDIKIPSQVGYGAIYDKEFEGFTPSTSRINSMEYELNHQWVPYLMLKNPDKLWIVYGYIFSLDISNIKSILEKLKDGHEQERKFTQWINDINNSPATNKLYIYREIVDMMIDGRIDLLDSVYFLVAYSSGLEFEAFTKYI